MGRKGAYIIYIVIFVVVLILPLAATAFGTSDVQQSEKRDLAEFPQLCTEDGSFNTQFFPELGSWFEDHFGLRGQMITADASLRRATVGSSPNDEVVIGKNGWLYYEGTLDDYLGTDPMSERELFMAAHNLKLVQEYVNGNGADFEFVIAANKNSLYPQNMPDHYIPSAAASNAERLGAALAQNGVNFVDMHGALSGQEGLYFERDSHWNGKGALIGYNEIMNGLARDHDVYTGTGWIARKDHAGDLETMLLPSAWTEEMNYYLDTEFTYRWTEGENVEDLWIETTNDAGEGTLLMFRDSFADGLIQYLSQEFETAYYSKYLPRYVARMEQLHPDDVVIEMVERSLLELTGRFAIMPAPEVPDVAYTGTAEFATGIAAETEGPYVLVTGALDAETLPTDFEIYLRLTDTSGRQHTYEPFYVSSSARQGDRFYADIPAQMLGDTFHAQVIAGAPGDLRLCVSREIVVGGGD